MAFRHSLRFFLLLRCALTVSAQAVCYWGPGAAYRIPDSFGVVPCKNEGAATCCRLGDTCLEGNACWNEATGNTYQYGCTDVSYTDPTCPYKCGWSPDESPWVALEFCPSFNGIEDTWNCQSPQSCGCSWTSTYEMLVLPVRLCPAMGSLARVALYATKPLPAYASLPSRTGGTTGYFSGTGSLPVNSYTPSSLGPTSSVSEARSIVVYDKNAQPASSYGTATLLNGSVPPTPITPSGQASSSIPSVTSSTASKTSSSTSSGSPTGSTHASTSTSSGGQGQTSPGGSGGDHSSGGGGGLTTGAKVGLGVGIAGGVCLIAAIVLVAVIMRRRKQRAIADATILHDKTHDSAAYYDPYNRGANVHEAPYTAQEEASVRKRMSPNGLLPELDAGTPIHEMDSTPNSNANTPSIGPSSPRIP